MFELLGSIVSADPSLLQGVPMQQKDQIYNYFLGVTDFFKDPGSIFLSAFYELEKGPEILSALGLDSIPRLASFLEVRYPQSNLSYSDPHALYQIRKWLENKHDVLIEKGIEHLSAMIAEYGDYEDVISQ